MLSFEYDESSGYPAVSVAQYQGLTIKAVQDESPGNPWEEWDGQPPLIYVANYRDGLTMEHAAGADDPLSAFSDYQISRKWRELCKALELDADKEQAELVAAQHENAPQWRAPLAELKRERLAEALGDSAPSDYSGNAGDYMETLESLWKLAGIDALSFSRNGYSQGDNVTGLLVATPAWRKVTGAGESYSLEGDADLFGAYYFGDVYGWVIDSPDLEHIDSCWGYYGTDFAKSGLAESALEAAESIIANATERRQSKLKELIRNRVPVMYRPALLAEACGALANVC